MAAAHHLRMQAAIHQQRHTGNEKLNKPPKTKNVSMNRNDTRGMSEHGFDTVANVCISRVLQRSRGYAIVEQATIGKNSCRSFFSKVCFLRLPDCVFLCFLTGSYLLSLSFPKPQSEGIGAGPGHFRHFVASVSAKHQLKAPKSRGQSLRKMRINLSIHSNLLAPSFFELTVWLLSSLSHLVLHRPMQHNDT